MHLGEVIKKYRDEHQKMSMQAFADKCGLSKGYIAMLERNVNSKTGEPVVPSIETFIKVAKAMNMTLDELTDKVDENQPISLISDEFSKNIKINQKKEIFDNIFLVEKKKFPLLGEIACGQPIFANEDRESYVLAGTDIEADFCLKAKGDSMIGARILDGDIVFIREQAIVEDGEIAAVIIDNEATLKRVYYEKGKNRLTLQAENPKYRPLSYEGEELDHIRILGKAVAFQSDII